MTETSVPLVTPVPSIADQLIAAVADKAATSLATLLIAAGALKPAGAAQFIALLAGLLVAAANLVVTYFAAHRRDFRLRAAVSSPAAIPVSK